MSTGEQTADPSVVKESCYAPEHLATGEREALAPRLAMAGGIEEIPELGDYLPYDIAGESIIVVRASSSEIRAHHNACQRLTEGLVAHGVPRLYPLQETVLRNFHSVYHTLFRGERQGCRGPG